VQRRADEQLVTDWVFRRIKPSGQPPQWEAQASSKSRVIALGRGSTKKAAKQAALTCTRQDVGEPRGVPAANVPSPTQDPTTEAGPSRSSKGGRIILGQGGVPGGRDLPVEPKSAGGSTLEPCNVPLPPCTAPSQSNPCPPKPSKPSITPRSKASPAHAGPTTVLTPCGATGVNFLRAPITEPITHRCFFSSLSHGDVTTLSVNGTITQIRSDLPPDPLNPRPNV